jgi:hypothetical protein
MPCITEVVLKFIVLRITRNRQDAKIGTENFLPAVPGAFAVKGMLVDGEKTFYYYCSTQFDHLYRFSEKEKN